jgi:hypothetical protein
MKTTRLIITAILVLLTSATFAQINRGLFASVKYSHDLNRFETWVSHIGDRISHENANHDNRPVISQTYYTDYAQISYENEAAFENWMATPFEEAIVENGPVMEDWMSQPFESDLSEEELYLEEWMSKPFETNESEDELCLEEWMSTPFKTGEEPGVENWMTASNQ